MVRPKLDKPTVFFFVTVVVSLSTLLSCEALPTREEMITKLATTPLCCESMSGISFAPFPVDRSQMIHINSASPAFEFDTGKSFFAAYVLPVQPMPYRIAVQSYPVGYSPTAASIFLPRLTLLDSGYNVLGSTDRGAFRFSRVDSTDAFKWTLSSTIETMFYLGGIAVSDPRAKYLVIHALTRDSANGVPYEYMDFVQIYAGSGFLVPIPAGKRQATIGHSPDGVFRMNIASVHDADIDKLARFGEPAVAPGYYGHGFKIRPPRPEGYRFADESPEEPRQPITHFKFITGKQPGAFHVARVQSIQPSPGFELLAHGALRYAADRIIEAQERSFKDYKHTLSRFEIRGTDCSRIDSSYITRNPLLLIDARAKGYDIVCVHPEFDNPLVTLVIRIGAHKVYPYGETAKTFPDELTNFYNLLQFVAVEEKEPD